MPLMFIACLLRPGMVMGAGPQRKSSPRDPGAYQHKHVSLIKAAMQPPRVRFGTCLLYCLCSFVRIFKAHVLTALTGQGSYLGFDGRSVAAPAQPRFAINTSLSCHHGIQLETARAARSARRRIKQDYYTAPLPLPHHVRVLRDTRRASQERGPGVKQLGVCS